MKQRGEKFSSVPSSLRLFLTVLVIFFITQAVVMLLLSLVLSDLHPLAASIADPAMMVALSAPFLWWFLVRPLRRIAVAEHVRAGTVIRRARDGIISMNEQGLIESFNPAAEHIFGYRAEEVVGKPLTLLMPEQYRDAHQRGVERARATATSDLLEGRMLEAHGLRKDGTEFPLECSVAGWTTGKEMLFVGIVRDVTERKRAEEQLRLQSTALAAAANGVVITDREGRITWVNPAFTRLTGYTAEEVLGQNPRLLKSGKHDQAFYQNLWETILAGQVWRSEVINRRKDGSLYTDYQVITPLRDASGAISHFVTIKEDITERKRTEEIRQALYEASREIQTSRSIEDRLARLLRTARDVLRLDRVNVLLADPAGRWLQAVASLGTEEPLEAIRVPIGPDGGGLAQAYLTQEAVLWNGRGPVPEALRIRPPYDSIEALRSRVFAIVPLVVQGRAIGVLGVDRKHSRQPIEPGILDLLQLFASYAAPAIEHARLYEELRRSAIHLEATVEDRTRDLQAANRKLEEALKQVEEASRHKSEFLANMSHELRTPLNAVIGFSELLLGQGVGPLTEKQARYVGHIHNSGKHLLQLISDILDLSKVEAGKITLEPAPLPVATTLEDILVIARGLANKKAQEIQAEIAPDLPPLDADPVRFKQVLFNLLSNAAKFTPGGGRITLTARRVNWSSSQMVDSSQPIDYSTTRLIDAAGDWLEIRVTDTGAGIKTEDLPRLFREFVQLETTQAQRHEGSGLGLALTKRLVELHGGRIWAESEGEGHGSTFTVLLPFGGPGAPSDA